jgi:hypothetical protein
MTKEGRPFWSLPKRPPHPEVFDPQNQTHAGFVAACACLLATIHKIKIPFENPREKETKLKISQIAEGFE